MTWDNQTAESPLNFPLPAIVSASVRRTSVSFLDNYCHKRSLEQSVLLTETKHFYEVGKKLGDSIYGEVRHAYVLQYEDNMYSRVSPKVEVAIKIYSKSKMKELEAYCEEQPLNELSAMELLGYHPNIINAIEYCQDDHFIYSIMEYCSLGELFSHIGRDKMTSPIAKIFFKEILIGLQHIHKNGIALRDLSLENILVSSEGVCKITDFGMSLRLPRDSVTGEILKVKPLRPCGKQNYIAPEALDSSSYYNPQLSDIWSAGCLLFIMLTGVPPYETSSNIDIRFRYLVSGQLEALMNHWNFKMDPEAIDLLNGIFKLNPDERLSIDKILHHSWFKSVIIK